MVTLFNVVCCSPVACVRRYNLKARTWEPVASMPRGVNHAAFGRIQEKFYVISGRIGGNVVDYGQPWIQVYDINSDTWTGSFTPGATAPI